MEQYIPKSVLVAEIENLENTYKNCPTRNSYEEGLKDGRLIGYKDALHKINTLEVKEVVTEQEGMCNGILNTIIGDTWHIKIPLDKAGLKHEDKVKIFITKEK